MTHARAHPRPRSVCEYGLSAAVGPLNVGVLAAGGADDGGWLAVRDAGDTGKRVGGCRGAAGVNHLAAWCPGHIGGLGRCGAGGCN